MPIQHHPATSQTPMSSSLISSTPYANGNGNGNSNENDNEDEYVWTQIKAEARGDAESEPALASYLYSTIISHSSLTRSLCFHLGNKLCSSTLLSTLLYDLFLNTFSSDQSLLSATVADLRAARQRDPACISFAHCLLNYKGFLAIQAHRLAHRLWALNRKPIALALHSRIADVFSVDIHPAARLGKGISLIFFFFSFHFMLKYYY